MQCIVEVQWVDERNSTDAHLHGQEHVAGFETLRPPRSRPSPTAAWRPTLAYIQLGQFAAKRLSAAEQMA